MQTYLVKYKATVYGSCKADICQRNIQSKSAAEDDILKALKHDMIENPKNETFCSLISYQPIPAGMIPISDIPNTCIECPCYQYAYHTHKCRASNKNLNKTDTFSPYLQKPDWCPIQIQ